MNSVNASMRIAGAYKTRFEVKVTLEWEKPSTSPEQDGARLLLQAMAQESADEATKQAEAYESSTKDHKLLSELESFRRNGGKVDHD